MTNKEAYERLELPDGADLQEVRRRFAELYNDYRMRIDNAPTARMRQTYEQHLEAVKEAYALLNESSGMDDTGDLPRTGQSGAFEALADATGGGSVGKETDEGIDGAFAVFGLAKSFPKHKVADFCRQQLAEWKGQAEAATLPTAKAAYEKELAKAQRAWEIIDRWLATNSAQQPIGQSDAKKQIPEETPASIPPQKRRNVLWYVLGIAAILLAGVLVWKFSGDSGTEGLDSPAAGQPWQPTHYISSQLGKGTLVLRKRALTADEQKQVATDAALNGETYAATLRAGDSIAVIAETDGYYAVRPKDGQERLYYLPREARTGDWIIKLGEPETPKDEPKPGPAAPPMTTPKDEPKPKPAPEPAAPAIPIPETVYVAGGTFRMGSDDGESDEQPVHSVTLSSYRVGKHEVTVRQYRAFCNATGRSMPRTPSWGWIDDHPAVNVSWHDAVAYCEWLSGQTGQPYRMPTEAEWEYAARGGNRSNGYTYSGGSSMDGVGWYSGNSGGKTHPVGSKRANELGIYDMSGNVWEWCNDWYGGDYYADSPKENPRGAASGSLRVLRGGSWNFDTPDCRVAYRLGDFPDVRRDHNGFRIVLSQ